MAITITLSIDKVSGPSESEVKVLSALSQAFGGSTPQVNFHNGPTATPEPKTEPKAEKAKPKKSEPKAEPKEKPKVDAKAEEKEPAKPEPKSDDKPAKDEADSSSGEDKLQEAVEAATALVTSGKTSVVKAALAKAGAKRVSELKNSNVQQFLDEIAEEG